MHASLPTALPVAPSQLGESPFWHPRDQALYWCDIAGRALHCFDPASGRHQAWATPSEPGCAAPTADGAIALALRDGVYRLNTRTGAITPIAAALHDPTQQRYNDGKCDAVGRFWIGTVFEPKTSPSAGLYCLQARDGHYVLERLAGDLVTANGLAFSPDHRTMYWADTAEHRIDCFDFDLKAGSISNRRVFARFERPVPGRPYGGRPDGAAIDREGNYWIAMYEGGRVLQLSPHGQLLQEIVVPARCPTMVCFGGEDLRTLYITTARRNRPPEELATTPEAGCVFALRVEAQGWPADTFAA